MKKPITIMPEYRGEKHDVEAKSNIFEGLKFSECFVPSDVECQLRNNPQWLPPTLETGMETRKRENCRNCKSIRTSIILVHS